MDRRPWNALQRARDWTEWLWGRVAEPKNMTLITAAGYLLGGIVGAYAIVHQPRSLEGAIGEAAMYALATLLALGAAIGLPTCVFGEWKIERWGIAFAAFASVIYIIIVLYLHLTGDGNRLLQAGYIALALLGMIARGSHVWQRPEAPEREKLASRQSGDEKDAQHQD